VKALFEAAVERPAEERAAFLAAATDGDAALRHEVEALLASDTSGVSFLDRLPVASESVLAAPLAALSAPMAPTLSRAVLAAGLRVGPYEVAGPLGAGAMGEVYRARDTKLHRSVALKVMPERFALDPDRSARFTREAQVLATLNHPNIGAIYGFEESHPSTGSGQAAVRALVLELVDGPTLAERIARGPISVNEALAIARQIADAVEAAHEKGIIHRDLKPANIKITPNGMVKVLDFGLAKVWDGAPLSGLSGAPSLTGSESGARTVLGTPAYMSPEQARGQPVDRRTDIWAFGCVLYEMLTGRAAFPGDTISDTLAAILEREPDWVALPATVPAAVRTLLRRCLEKDGRQRIADISVARFVFDDLADVAPASAPGSSPAAPRPPSWRRLAILAGAWLVGAAMAGSAVWFAVRSTASPRVSRLLITPPGAAALSVGVTGYRLAVTPDGTRVVYVGANNTALFVRALDRLDATSITGLADSYGPFVSPDGQWIGFFEGVSALKKVAITGGPAVMLGRPGGTAMGASWGADGTIIFATNDRTTGLRRVADAGEPTVLTRPNRAAGEDDHLWPEILPGGQAVLFTITATTGGLDQAQVAVLDLRTHTQTVLIRGGSHARYVSSGHVVYGAAGRLHAVAFDLARLAVVGTPVMVQPEVPADAGWAVAADGTLVYVSGRVQAVQRSLVWVDRQGQETSIPAPPRNYAFPRLSPDGGRLALYIPDQEIDIWLWDLARATLTRATFDRGVDIFPVWPPDGRRLFFSSVRAGGVNLFAQAADGSGDVTRLTTSPNVQHATSVSPDGARLVFTETAAATGPDVMQFRLDGTNGVTPLVQTPLSERNGEVSPDGRWLAYEANYDSGRFNIYVRPFPDASSGYWQVSTDGGTRPLWARNTNSPELFYLSATGALMRVGVAPGPTWAATAPTKLFEGRYGAAANQSGRTYDVAPDGKRFLMIKAGGSEDQTAVPTSLVVVQNWREELNRLAPTH
jgi:serine/threonine-protein kinase